MTPDTATLNDVQELPRSAERRTVQRDRLVACAEAAVSAQGLSGLRARDLAAGVGCSVGAIYNLVADLDELALLVAQRTMADLHARLDDAGTTGDATPETFVALALAYCRFATTHRNRWRALFEHRLPPGKPLPDWFEADQTQLFRPLEERLGQRLPHLAAATLRLRARSLFSAVHGIIALGLEEKIVAMPVATLETELAVFVRTYLAGLTTSAAEASRPALDAETAQAAQAFLQRLEGIFPVITSILFGSRARGTHRVDSDADIAVVLEGRRGDRNIAAREMAGIAFDVMLETGILVQALPLWIDEFQRPELFSNPSLIETIRHEGLPL